LFWDDLQAAVQAHPRVLPVVLQAVATHATRGWLHTPHLQQSMVGGMVRAMTSGKGAATRQVLATASKLGLHLSLLSWERLADAVGLNGNKDVVVALLDQLAAPGNTLATPDDTVAILQWVLRAACQRGHLRTVRQVLAFGVAHRVQLDVLGSLCAAIDRGHVAAIRALSEYKYADKDALMRADTMRTKQFSYNYWWADNPNPGRCRNPMENALRAAPATLNAVLCTEWGREWVTRRPKWCLKTAVACCWNTASTLRALLCHDAAPDWAPYMASALRLANYLPRYHALLELATPCNLEAVRRAKPSVLAEIDEDTRTLLVDTEAFPKIWEKERTFCVAVRKVLEPWLATEGCA
jgi:hypothetical protein